MGIVARGEHAVRAGGSSMGRQLLAGLCTLGVILSASARAESADTFHAITSGPWSEPTTWDLGYVPSAGDFVEVEAGTTVTYDVTSTAELAQVTVHGTLSFSRTTNTLMDVGLLVVLPGGHLEVGSEMAPIPEGVTATIRLVYLPGVTYTHLHGNPNLVPAVHAHGGTIDLHGAPRAHPWTLLSRDAVANATSLTVAEDVSDWRVGDRIIVTGTNKMRVKGQTSDAIDQPAVTSAGCDIRTDEFNCLDSSTFQVEEATIASISGQTITLSAPLDNTHLGTFPRQAAVGLLSHNVVITSKDPAGRRGNVHMASGFVIPNSEPLPTPIPNPVIGRLSAVEFRDLGRSLPGVYPVHFHRLGPGGRDSYVKGCSIHHSQNLCVRVHTTHFLTVANNVCYDVLGHGYTTEDGSEVYNTFKHNLASRTKHNIPTNPNDPSDVNEGSGFWFNNPRNYVIDNYAADADAWGYQIDPITIPEGGAPPRGKSLPVVDMNGVPTPPVPITSLEILSFDGNTTYGNYRGGAELINLDTVAANTVTNLHAIDGRLGDVNHFGTRMIFENLYALNGMRSGEVASDIGTYSPGGFGGVILSHPRHVLFKNSVMEMDQYGYQFDGSVAYENTRITQQLLTTGYGTGALKLISGTSQVNGLSISINTNTFPPNSTTQEELYLYDIDGPDRHIKLTPLGTIPTDGLTYRPSRFLGTFCSGTERDSCFQEASFTGPANSGPAIKLPFFINAGSVQNAVLQPGISDPQDIIDADGKRWALDNSYTNPPPGYNMPRYGAEARSSTYGPDVDRSIYDSTAGALGIAYVDMMVPMTYRIDVPNGTYHVDLHFIENWQLIPDDVTSRGIGTRVFDVKAEGNTVISQLDVYKEVGLNTPLIKSFDVPVSDGQLTLEWPDPYSMISGIAVR